MTYKITARSPSDPNGDKGGLGFNTLKEAQQHQQAMNLLIETYDDIDSLWDKKFWKTKPEQWQVHEQ